MSYDPRACGALCDACPLQGQQVVPPEGNQHARVAIVNETPGISELKFGKQWIGPAGAKLNELLYKAGLTRHQLWMTSALLCRPEVPDENGRNRYDPKRYMAWLRRENVKIKRHNKATKTTWLKAGGDPANVPGQLAERTDPFSCCAPRLQNELRTLDAQARAAGAPNGLVVQPLGNFALGDLTLKPGASQSILKYRGSVIFPKQEAVP